MLFSRGVPVKQCISHTTYPILYWTVNKTKEEMRRIKDNNNQTKKERQNNTKNMTTNMAHYTIKPPQVWNGTPV